MKKVLVVEDNKDNLRIMKYALERSGYEVVSTERGEDAVDLVMTAKPCFIIMDINLPGIDGIETTRQIRHSKSNGSVPIIAITSYAMVGDREKILAAGCNGYIEKPIDPVTIIGRIHEIIGAGSYGAEK